MRPEAFRSKTPQQIYCLSTLFAIFPKVRIRRQTWQWVNLSVKQNLLKISSCHLRRRKTSRSNLHWRNLFHPSLAQICSALLVRLFASLPIYLLTNLFLSFHFFSSFSLLLGEPFPVLHIHHARPFSSVVLFLFLGREKQRAQLPELNRRGLRLRSSQEFNFRSSWRPNVFGATSGGARRSGFGRVTEFCKESANLARSQPLPPLGRQQNRRGVSSGCHRDPLKFNWKQ